jgi:hypothetical protein
MDSIFNLKMQLKQDLLDAAIFEAALLGQSKIISL